MKAITNTGPNRLELLDLPLPEPRAGQVLIRTGACGICATDLLMVAGWTRTGFPAVPGHEWSGTVDAAGQRVDPSIVGRRCVADNILSDGGEVGFEHPGGYGEYFVTEAAGVRLLPDSFPLATAALAEPLSVSLRAVRRLRPNNLGRALVMGDGPIGLMLVMLLKRAGADEIVMVGGRRGRLALARELGAYMTLNHHELGEHLAESILDAAGGPFNVAVEASGGRKAMRALMRLVKNEGRILVLGDYGEARADFLWNDLLHHEVELIGSNTGSGAWDEAVQILASGSLPLDRLVTHRFHASQFEDAYELVRKRTEDVVKVVLEWQCDEQAGILPS